MKKRLRILTLGLMIVVILAMLSGCDSISVEIQGSLDRVEDNLDEPENPACEHEGGTPTCTDKAVCVLCGKEYGEAIGHEIVVDAAVAPTCTKTGLTEGKRCSACFAILVSQRLVPIIDHIESDWIIDREANESEDGARHTQCTMCGQRMSEKTIPATGSVGLAYEINADGISCTITGMGTCTDSKVNIHSKIDGYTVTAIGKKAFAENSTITAIKIPNTVTTIDTRAFYKCTEITEFTIPENVISIGTQIFYGCDKLTTVYYNSSYVDKNNPFLSVKNIETVVFGGTSIPSYFAYMATFLKTIIISDGVTSIDKEAFYNCSSLKNVTIGDSVTSIGYSAFENCSSLTSIEIPDSVTSIGYFAFYNCTSLTSIEIPDSVTSIESSTFRKCTNLTSVTIPDSVISIGDYAFESCTSLTSITIPDSVTSIGLEAFCGCSSLTSVTIPDSVTKIGINTFFDCTSLTSIEISDSVTLIGGYAFYGCTSLKNVYYIGGAEEWSSISITWYGNSNIIHANRYYFSETQPIDTTYDYWHYVDGVPTKW